MSFKDLNVNIQLAFPNCKESKGLEKLMCKSSIGVVKLGNTFEIIFYGKPDEVNNFKNGILRPKDPLKLGIIPIVRLIASINYCDIVGYGISKVPRGSANDNFDPDKPPGDDAPGIKRSLWKLQKVSYDSQTEIDKFMSQYLDVQNPESKNALFKLMRKLKKGLTTDINTIINERFLESNDPNESKSGLDNLINSATQTRGFAAYQSLGGNGLGDATSEIKTLITAFPMLQRANLYLNGVFSAIDGYSDWRQIPDKDFQKFMLRIQNIRKLLISIQSLSSPLAFLTGVGLTLAGPSLANISEKVQSIIKPERAIPFLKKIISVCRKIQSICQTLLNIIQVLQMVIKIVMVIIIVIKFIAKLLKKLPIPNIYTTTGITTTISDTATTLDKEVIGKPEKPNTLFNRLGQALFLCELIRILINSVLAPINEIIKNINLIIIQLSNCPNMDKDVLDDLIGARDGMQKYADMMYLFSKNKELNDAKDGIYDPNSRSVDDVLNDPPNMDDNGLSDYWGVNPFIRSGLPKDTRNGIDASGVNDPSGKLGQYDIKIVNEEVVEPTFNLRRRYGVALDNKGIVVVQTPPTYASDSQIIIEEVKQLLLSKNLVQHYSSLYTNDEKALIQTVENYLFDNTLNWDNFPNLSNNRSVPENGTQPTRTQSAEDEEVAEGFSPKDVGYTEDDGLFDTEFLGDIDPDLDQYSMDPPDNEDEDKGLGLNAFVNKLKGGRKLRNRMRKMMEKILSAFKKDTDKAKQQTPIESKKQIPDTKVNDSFNKQTQNPNVDLTRGDNSYFGIVKNSSGQSVASIQLRADDAELAKQKLIDKYDPNQEKNYTYIINPG